MDITASVGLSLTGAELPTAAAELRARLATEATSDLHLALGLATYLLGGVEEAELHLRHAFLGFQRAGRTRRAAVAAAHLGRVEYHGFVNPVVAAGWFTRGLQLLENDPDCPERGWLALGMLGCSVASARDLHGNAELALQLARRHQDTDLECRALADYGLALVDEGDCESGMANIDHAMTMVHSGECTNLYITGQVQCSFISACERSADIPRLEGWLTAAVRAQPHVLGPQAAPNLMLNHCRTEYGSLLCLSGRWREAEATLRQAATDAPRLQKHQQVLANCALAELRVSQGRLAEAMELLDGLDGWDEARLPLARLHLARGEWDLAAAGCRVALLHLAGDRLRGSRMLGVLVDAELGRGDSAAAAAAARELAESATAAANRPVQARAALAGARVAQAAGQTGAAVDRLREGLGLLRGEHWALLCAELHLELAAALAGAEPVTAAGHARKALAVYGPIGAPQGFAAQRLLTELGSPEPGQDPLAVLTPREREILQLLAQGLSNPQIAARLVISAKTAEHHVGAILRKLQLSSRSEAAVYAATLSR